MRGTALLNSGYFVVRGMLIAAAALLATFAAILAFESQANRPQVAIVPVAEDTVASDAFKFSFFDPPRALPELRFVDGEDRALSLGDFRGRSIVLNIWATWCVPCRKEMPALDRLQAAIDASRLLVLPLSIDRKGTPAVKQFYQELGLETLGIYVDQSGKAANDLNTVGVPTTLLIDRQGQEIGRKIGPAEWDRPEMVVLIRERLGLLPGEGKANP